MIPAITATSAIDAVSAGLVRDADSGNARPEFEKAVANYAELLAALEHARRAALFFADSVDALYPEETRRHDLAGVREDAVHAAYGLARDVSIMESTANRKINLMTEKATERLWQASRVS